MRNTMRYILWSFAVLTIARTSGAVSQDDDHKGNVVEKCGGDHVRAGSPKTKKRTKNAPHASATKAAKSPNYSVTTDSKYPDIAIVTEGTTALIQSDNIDICTAGEAFYAKFKDNRDMLFVFAQSEAKDLAIGYNAYYQGYRNFVSGIGLSVDGKDTPLETVCGSEKRLLGIANMNSTEKWKPWAAPLLDTWPLGVIAHEIGHQWISYLTSPVKGKTEDGKTVEVTLGSDSESSNRGHWRELVHTSASIMYGNSWLGVPLTKEKWVSTLFPREFTKLDKYLMGIDDGSDIGNLFVIEADKSNIPKHYARPGNTASGIRVDVTIEAIKQSYGTRAEHYPSGGHGNKKTFTTGFILVVPKGEKIDPSALKVVEYFRKRIPEKMSGATDGAFTFTTDIKSR